MLSVLQESFPQNLNHGFTSVVAYRHNHMLQYTLKQSQLDPTDCYWSSCLV